MMTEARKARLRFVLDTSPLRISPAFRRIFIARTISIFGLGMLAVAIPVQVFELTDSTLHVGMAASIEGICAFAGLLFGGVAADRFDRRTIIIASRVLGGLGFAVLALNAWVPEPSLATIYLVGAIDGFFGGFSVTALMAVTPSLIPRDKLPAAGALNLLSVRLGTMISPAIGGLVIAAGGVGWNYAGAAGTTFLTILLLLGLPPMRPEKSGEPQHPLRSAIEGASFVYRNRIVRSVVLIGTLETAASGVRVLLPALAVAAFGVGPEGTGLLYSAVPVGAVAATLLSGWVGDLKHPGRAMLLLATGSFAALAILGLCRDLVHALIALAIFGALSSLSSILQYSLVQQHTPDRLLGRVNALWMAQEVGAESGGALALGGLGKLVAASSALTVFGAAAAAAGLAGLLGFRSLTAAAPATAEQDSTARQTQNQESNNHA
ncbi:MULTISPECIES: enterobactin transporter EntS [unclassified Paenarthrobacter]